MKKLQRDLFALRASLARPREDDLDTEKVGRELAEVQAHLRSLSERLAPRSAD
ncbi:MAG TPA: hypothetical protein VGJ25_10740 [Gaiellaceae bacterium]